MGSAALSIRPDACWVTLTNGMNVRVDPDDYERLADRTWTALKRPHAKCVYACTGVNTPKGRRVLLMHRDILNALPGQELDHINGNGLDNRKCNLRFVTSGQNHAARSRKISKSGFKGVQQHPKTPHRWQAVVSLGAFPSAEEAARCHDHWSMLIWGEFARLNFPNDGGQS